MKDNRVDEYLKQFPKDTSAKCENIRKIVLGFSDIQETISYMMPTYKLNGKNLVHFAAYKNHIGFYPTPSAIVKFAKELTQYKTSKGAIQFQLKEEIPINLIERIVKFRIGEILDK